MAKLRLCIMVHLEDNTVYSDSRAVQYGGVGSIAAFRGARMS